ncbi:MAG: bile acid:sodium symporter [Planctomycetota bacterium]
MSRWLKSNWFLLALALTFLFGYFAAENLEPLARQVTLRSTLVMLVMWAMGITLRADAIRNSIRRPTASLLAIGINVVFVPLMCVGVMHWLSPDMGGGLFVAGLVPCTLASASVWVRKAGGDDSIAIITTTVTNLATIAVVPIGIQWVISAQSEVSAADQMQKLALFVVAPLGVAQLMRRFGWAVWADRNKKRLSLAAQFGILVMVAFGAVVSRSYGDDSNASISLVMLLLVTMLALAVHVIALTTGIGASRVLGLTRESQIAVGIAGSQKTLMVGLQIAIDCGVSVLPMMIYHASQLVFDTIIVQRWAKATPEDESSQE